MEYGDVHRAAVQVFLARKHMSEKETREEIRKVFALYQIPQPPPTTDKELSAFFNVINEEIGHGGINHAEIKRLKIEGFPEPIWGLAQVVLENEQDAMAKEGALKELRWLTPSQLELFKLVVESIVRAGGSRGGKIDINKACNLGRFSSNRRRSGGDDEEAPLPSVKDLQPKEAEQTLERLVELEWLRIELVSDAEARGTHNNKRVTLGVRSILDLRKYIETCLPPHKTALLWRYEELCCVWTNGGDFKWIASASNDDEEEIADKENQGATGKRAASGREGAGGEDTEDEDEGGGDGAGSSRASKRQQREGPTRRSVE